MASVYDKKYEDRYKSILNKYGTNPDERVDPSDYESRYQSVINRYYPGVEPTVESTKPAGFEGAQVSQKTSAPTGRSFTEGAGEVGKALLGSGIGGVINTARTTLGLAEKTLVSDLGQQGKSIPDALRGMAEGFIKKQEGYEKIKQEQGWGAYLGKVTLDATVNAIMNNPGIQAIKRGINMGKDMTEYRQTAVDNLLKPIEKNVKEWADVEDESWIVRIGAGALASMPQTLLTRANPAIGVPLIFNNAFQNSMEQYEAEGLDPNDDEVRMRAIGSAAVETASEYIFGFMVGTKSLGKSLVNAGAVGTKTAMLQAGKGFLDGLLERGAKEVIKPTLWNFIKTIGKESAKEGLEEVVSEFGQGLVALATTEQGRKYFTLQEYTYTDPETGEEYLDTEKTGVVTGSGVRDAFFSGALAAGIMSYRGTATAFSETKRFLQEEIGTKSLNDITQEDVNELIDHVRSDVNKSDELKQDVQNTLSDTFAEAVAADFSNTTFTQPATGDQLTASLNPKTMEVVLTSSITGQQVKMTVDEFDQHVSTGFFAKNAPAQVQAQPGEEGSVSYGQQQATNVPGSGPVATGSPVAAQTGAGLPQADQGAPAASQGLGGEFGVQPITTNVFGKTTRSYAASLKNGSGNVVQAKASIDPAKGTMTVTANAVDQNVPVQVTVPASEYLEAENKAAFLNEKSNGQLARLYGRFGHPGLYAMVEETATIALQQEQAAFEAAQRADIEEGQQQKAAEVTAESKNIQNQIKQDRVKDTEQKAKESKAEGYRGAADRRAAIQGESLEPVDGGMTAKELEAHRKSAATRSRVQSELRGEAKGKNSTDIEPKVVSRFKTERSMVRRIQERYMPKEVMDALRAVDADFDKFGVVGWLNPMKDSDLNKQQKTMKEILKSETGKDIVFTTAVGATEANEFVSDWAKDTVFVNTTSRSDRDVMWAVGHGLHHLMVKDGRGDIFTKAVKSILPKGIEDVYLASFDGLPEYQQHLKDSGLLMEEIVADRAGEVFTSTKFWADLAKRTGVKQRSKLLDSISKFLDRISAITTTTNSEVEAMVHAFDQYRNPTTDSTQTEIPDDDDGNIYSISRMNSDQTKTNEFKNWFNGSKVIDKNGNPAVLYHGTTSSFNAFRPGDVGIHFGTKGQARSRVGRGKNTRIIPVYLSIQNPLVIDHDFGSWDGDYAAQMMVEWEEFDSAKDVFELKKISNMPTRMANSALRSFLKSKGYDGIKYINRFEGTSTKEEYSYIAFDPTQVKSATENVGSFDASNPDIRYSLRPEIVDKAVQTFGTTYNVNEAGYILPDGRLLDFSGKRQGARPGGRSMDHRDVQVLYEGFDTGTDAMKQFQGDTNAVRVSVFGSVANFDVTATEPLTDKQIMQMKRAAARKDAVTIDFYPDTKANSPTMTWEMDMPMSRDVDAAINEIQSLIGFDNKFSVGYPGQIERWQESLSSLIKAGGTNVDSVEAAANIRQSMSDIFDLFDEISTQHPTFFDRFNVRTPLIGKGPLRQNTGGYIWTFDMDTSCTRTLQYKEYVRQMTADLGRFPNQQELIALMFHMRASGDMIPCIYCYVESKRTIWMDAYNSFNETRNAITKRMTEYDTVQDAWDDLSDIMYGTKIRGKMPDESIRVFERWFHEAKAGTPALDPKELYAGYQESRSRILSDMDADVSELGKIVGNNLTGTKIDKLTDMLAERYGIEKNVPLLDMSWSKLPAPGKAKDGAVLNPAYRSLKNIVSEWAYDYTVAQGGKPEHENMTYGNLSVSPVHLANFADALDYMASSSSSKKVDRFERYVDQLEKISIDDKINQNAYGGFRIHSSNDFRIDHAMDYVLFLSHLANDERGGMPWYAHMYTKSVECARFMAKTGVKINMSIAMTTNPDGSIVENGREGTTWKDVIQLRKLSPDIGAMAMVTDDTQLDYALTHDWIDQIIPFHSSGMKKVIYNDLLEWMDYTRVQSDSAPNAVYMREKLRQANAPIVSEPGFDDMSANDLMPHFRSRLVSPINKPDGSVYIPHFLPNDQRINIGTAKNPSYVDIPGHGNNATEYLRLCEEYGVMPRFWGHIMPDGRRLTEYPPDQYVKLLKETSRTDTPQTGVRAEFDPGYIREMLEGHAAQQGYTKLETISDSYHTFMRDYFKDTPGGKQLDLERNPMLNTVRTEDGLLGAMSNVDQEMIRIDNERLESFRDNPSVMVYAHHLPGLSDMAKPALIEHANRILAGWKSENAIFLTRDQQIGAVTAALGIAEAYQDVREALIGRNLYSLRSGLRKNMTSTEIKPDDHGGIINIFAPLAGFKKTWNHLDFVGLPAGSYREIAAAAMIARDPRFEHNQLYYAKDDKIIAHESWTSYLPSAAAAVPFQIRGTAMVPDSAEENSMASAQIDQQIERIKKRAAKIGADSIFMSHNHPSGDPEPSAADRGTTFTLAKKLAPLFKTMIVVDHNSYSYIIPKVNENKVAVGKGTFTKGMPGYKRNDPYGHKKLPDITEGGTIPLTPEAVINKIGETVWTTKNTFVPEDKIMLVYVDARSRITGIQAVPTGMLNNSDNFEGFVHNQRAYFGGSSVFAVASTARGANNLIPAFKSKTLLDVIMVNTHSGSPESLMQITSRPAPKKTLRGLESVMMYENQLIPQLPNRPSPDNFEMVPETGQYPAIATDDGGLFWDVRGRTHVQFAKDMDIPVERIVSGGWLVNGVYEATQQSDTMRWVAAEKAKQRVEFNRAMRKLETDKQNLYSLQRTADIENQFKDSKIRNEDGSLKVMYHGTTESFTEFMGDRRGLFFLTTSKRFAEKFRANGFGARPNIVMELYANSTKPLDPSNMPQDIVDAIVASHMSLFDKGETIPKDFEKNLVNGLRSGEWSWFEKRATLKAIREFGYDGIWLYESEQDKKNGIRTLALFSPEQVKSPLGYNAVDMKNPDIRYSIREHGWSKNLNETYYEKPVIDLITDAARYYEVQSNRETLEKASIMLRTDEAMALAEAQDIGKTSPELTVIRMAMTYRAQMAKKYDEAAQWAYVTNKAAKTAAQAVQAHAMFRKLDPQGVLAFAAAQTQRYRKDSDQVEVENKARDVRNAVLMAELNALRKALADAQAINEALAKDNASLKSKIDAAKRLDERIREYMGQLGEFDADPVKDFIELMHGVATTLFPIQDMPKTQDPVQFMRWVVRNGDKSRELWSMTIRMFNRMHEADRLGKAEIIAYFGDLMPNGMQSDLPRTQFTPEMIQAISSAFKSEYSSEYRTFQSMVKRLLELGVTERDAVILVRHMQKAIGDLSKEEKIRTLRRLLPKPNDSKTQEFINKIVNLTNDQGLTSMQVQAYLGNLLGLPGLTPELARELTDLSTQMANINQMAASEGRRLTPEEQRDVDVLSATILARIAAQKPVHWTQKVDTIQSMMMLSMFKSAERNIIGNSLFLATDTGKDFLAAGIDRILSTFTGTKSIPLPQFGAMIAGAKRGFKEAAYDIAHDIDTSSLDVSYSVQRGEIFKSKLGKAAMRLFKYKMVLPDRVAQGMAYESYLRGLMKMNGITNVQDVTQDMIDAAILHAQIKTFTDDNIYSRTFGNLREVLNNALRPAYWKSGRQDKVEWGLGSTLIKFPRVPGALLARSIEYSPISLLQAVGTLVKPALEAKKFGGTYGERFAKNYQKKFATQLANGMFGSAITIGLGLLLANLGLITGRREEDKKKRDMLEAMGVTQNQLNWTGLLRWIGSGFDPEAAKMREGDTLTSYEWMAPMSLGIAIGANIHQETETLRGADIPKLDKFLQIAMVSSFSGMESITDMSLMRGIADFMDNTGYRSNIEGADREEPYFAERIINAAVGIPATFVPNALVVTRQLLSNVKRSSYSTNALEYSYRLLLNKIPGAADTLPPQVDVFGNLKEVYQANGNNVWNVFFNPAWVTKYTPKQEAILVLNTMAEKEGTVVESRNVTPGKVSTKIPVTLNGVKQELVLDDYERAEMQQIVGKTAEKYFAQIPADMPLEERVKLMNNILSEVSQAAKTYMAKKKLGID